MSAHGCLQVAPPAAARPAGFVAPARFPSAFAVIGSAESSNAEGAFGFPPLKLGECALYGDGYLLMQLRQKPEPATASRWRFSCVQRRVQQSIDGRTPGTTSEDGFKDVFRLGLSVSATRHDLSASCALPCTDRYATSVPNAELAKADSAFRHATHTSIATLNAVVHSWLRPRATTEPPEPENASIPRSQMPAGTGVTNT